MSVNTNIFSIPFWGHEAFVSAFLLNILQSFGICLLILIYAYWIISVIFIVRIYILIGSPINLVWLIFNWNDTRYQAFNPSSHFQVEQNEKKKKKRHQKNRKKLLQKKKLICWQMRRTLKKETTKIMPRSFMGEWKERRIFHSNHTKSIDIRCELIFMSIYLHENGRKFTGLIEINPEGRGKTWTIRMA